MSDEEQVTVQGSIDICRRLVNTGPCFPTLNWQTRDAIIVVLVEVRRLWSENADLVERNRIGGQMQDGCEELAAEVAELRAENAELRKIVGAPPTRETAR